MVYMYISIYNINMIFINKVFQAVELQCREGRLLGIGRSGKEGAAVLRAAVREGL